MRSEALRSPDLTCADASESTERDGMSSSVTVDSVA